MISHMVKNSPGDIQSSQTDNDTILPHGVKNISGKKNEPDQDKKKQDNIVPGMFMNFHNMTPIPVAPIAPTSAPINMICARVLDDRRLGLNLHI